MGGFDIGKSYIQQPRINDEVDGALESAAGEQTAGSEENLLNPKISFLAQLVYPLVFKTAASCFR
jgi:hypothetical protein